MVVNELYEKLEKIYDNRRVNDKDDPTLGVWGQTYSDLNKNDRDTHSSTSSNSRNEDPERGRSSADRREEREIRNW